MEKTLATPTRLGYLASVLLYQINYIQKGDYNRTVREEEDCDGPMWTRAIFQRRTASESTEDAVKMMKRSSPCDDLTLLPNTPNNVKLTVSKNYAEDMVVVEYMVEIDKTEFVSKYKRYTMIFLFSDRTHQYTPVVCLCFEPPKDVCHDDITEQYDVLEKLLENAISIEFSSNYECRLEQ